MSEGIKVKVVPRQVLDGKLLAALDGKSKVVIVCSEEDLRLLISALTSTPVGWGDRRIQMVQDLEQLLKEAFGVV